MSVDHGKPVPCRFCGSDLRFKFVDLGMSPLCESFLSTSQLNQMEPFYPLHLYVCDSCYLVQLEEYVSRSVIFREYAYFSSYSDSWVRHAKTYAEMIAERIGLGADSFVVELASNDGYLLQHFRSLGIPVLGVEPAVNVAKAAVSKGIPTHMEFFGAETARELAMGTKQPNLIIGNNVLAQVPDLNDFLKGVKLLLNSTGVVTMEFPHLMRLIGENQFDTIYHEHFSYFSFYAVEHIFAAHGLTLFDVEELSTHGGSLRIYGRHTEDLSKPITHRIQELRTREIDAGIAKLEYYRSFGEQVEQTKWNLLDFLIQIKKDGKSVAGYGAPGKGNTLLNYCGIRTDFVDYTVDRNPYKHGKYTPGTHIPIYPVEHIRETKPDYLLILPWNLEEEIVQQMSYVREWNGQFIRPIPTVHIRH